MQLWNWFKMYISIWIFGKAITYTRFVISAILTLLIIVFAVTGLWRNWPNGIVLPGSSVKISSIALFPLIFLYFFPILAMIPIKVSINRKCSLWWFLFEWALGAILVPFEVSESSLSTLIQKTPKKTRRFLIYWQMKLILWLIFWVKEYWKATKTTIILHGWLKVR